MRRSTPEHYLLRTAYYFLLATSYLLPTTYYPLPATYYLLLTSYYELPTTYHVLLPTAYCLIPTRFSPEQRSAFMRFVWGRSRLPASAAEWGDMKFTIHTKHTSQPDGVYPVAHT